MGDCWMVGRSTGQLRRRPVASRFISSRLARASIQNETGNTNISETGMGDAITQRNDPGTYYIK